MTTLYEDLERACEERDTARAIAMRLEEENAELLSAIVWMNDDPAFARRRYHPLNVLEVVE